MNTLLGKGLIRKFALVGSLAALMSVSACHEIKGGGWLEGAYGGKATFGFQAKCRIADLGFGEPGPAFHEGQFQFHDKRAGVSFHGDLNFWIAGFSPEPQTCKENTENSGDPLNEGRFVGTCFSQPGKVEGTMVVTIADNGTPGELSDDLIGVYATCTDTGTPYSTSAGYLEPFPGFVIPNGVPIGGGNIVSVGHHN